MCSMLLASRSLRVSSLCLCPVDPADRTPASCACCATPNAPAPSASRSVWAHEMTQKVREPDCNKTGRPRAESPHVFQRHQRGATNQNTQRPHERTSISKLSIRLLLLKDDRRRQCCLSCSVLQHVVLQQATLTTRWTHS